MSFHVHGQFETQANEHLGTLRREARAIRIARELADTEAPTPADTPARHTTRPWSITRVLLALLAPLRRRHT